MTRPNRHLLLACLALASACSKTGTTNSPVDDRPAATTPTTGSPGTASTGTTGPMGTAAVEQPSDAQIVHILLTANTAEVDDGNLALRKAIDPRVKEFATRMVTDHSAANVKTETLVSTLGLTPEDNETSQSLKKAHDATTARLQTLDDAAFDRAYVDAAVDMHAEVLETIDTVLLPNAEAPELEVLLTEVRPTIAAHLDHAKRLQATMTSSTDTN